MNTVIEMNYKTNVYKNGNLKIKLPAKIGRYIEYKQYVIFQTNDGIKNSDWMKNGKMRETPIEGIKLEYYYSGGNVFCYNALGELVWQWPEKGVVGITIYDKAMVEESRVFKGIQEGLILDTAGPSYIIQVDVETGSELNRWQDK